MKVLDLSYHPLDVRSGGWVDLSRKGNHGVPYGGARPYMIAPGVMGFEFDGSSGYVEIPDSPSLDITEEITVSVWVYQYSRVLNENKGILEKGWEQSNILRDREGKNYRFAVFDTDEVSRGVLTTFNPSSQLRKWLCLVGTVKGGVVTIYANGFYDNSEDYEPFTIRTGVSPLKVGVVYGSYYWHGLIAQPIIENRAWSPDEVREDYYRSPIYRMLKGLPHSMIYTKIPWKQTQGGIYVP